MSLKNANVPIGATFAPTGGTATAFTTSAQPVSGGLMVVASADTDPSTRRSITAKAKNAAVDSKTGKFSGKDKRNTVFVSPTILADGSVVFDLIRIEIELHPQSATTKLAALKSAGICMLQDTDFDQFWALGSVE